jgi:hypothetical protein
LYRKVIVFWENEGGGVANSLKRDLHISTRGLGARSHFDFGFGLFEVSDKSLDNLSHATGTTCEAIMQKGPKHLGEQGIFRRSDEFVDL